MTRALVSASLSLFVPIFTTVGNVKGVLRPVGSEPARVYWVRRLVVLAVAVVVLVSLVLFVSNAFGGEKKAEPDPTPTNAQDDAKPAPDEPCKPADLALAMSSAPEAVTAGKDAAFDVSVTNKGEYACTVDVGDESRVLTITSGSDRIWASADCASDEDASRLVLLKPGSAHTSTVVWDGERSNKKCDSDLPKPRPGTYNLEIEMNGVKPAEHRFNIS